MDFFSQLLLKQQAPPPQSEARKKQIADAKKAEENRKKYLTNYRTKATQAVEDFIEDPQRLKMKFAPADQIIRGIIHQIAEEKGLISHSFGEEGVDRYVYIYKQEYHLTEAELACYREGRKWDPSYQPMASSHVASPNPDLNPNPNPSSNPNPNSKSNSNPNSNSNLNLNPNPNPHTISSTNAILPEQAVGESSRTAAAKRKTSELNMARMSAQSAEVVRISRESFGNVPTSGKTDRRTMAEVQSDIQAKKRLKTQVEKPEEISEILEK